MIRIVFMLSALALLAAPAGAQTLKRSTFRAAAPARKCACPAGCPCGCARTGVCDCRPVTPTDLYLGIVNFGCLRRRQQPPAPAPVGTDPALLAALQRSADLQAQVVALLQAQANRPLPAAPAPVPASPTPPPAAMHFYILPPGGGSAPLTVPGTPLAPLPVGGTPLAPLPIAGTPLAPLPVPGAPAAPLPIPGTPAAPLPVGGAPRAPLPIAPGPAPLPPPALGSSTPPPAGFLHLTTTPVRHALYRPVQR